MWLQHCLRPELIPARTDCTAALLTIQPLPAPLCFSAQDPVATLEQPRRTYVLTDKVAVAGHRVRAGPSLSAPVLAVLPRGARVTAITELINSEGWRAPTRTLP